MANAYDMIVHCGWHQSHNDTLQYACIICEGQVAPSTIIGIYWCKNCERSIATNLVKEAPNCPFCEPQE